jgi:hypothetical protein
MMMITTVKDGSTLRTSWVRHSIVAVSVGLSSKFPDAVSNSNSPTKPTPAPFDPTAQLDGLADRLRGQSAIRPVKVDKGKGRAAEASTTTDRDLSDAEMGEEMEEGKFAMYQDEIRAYV